MIIFRPHALLLLADVAPNLIAFDITYLYVADLFSHDPFALLASENQELQNCGVVYFGSAFNAGYAVAFEQEPENYFRPLNRQVHAVQEVVARLSKKPPALGALVALAVLTLPELPAFDPAVAAGHGISC